MSNAIERIQGFACEVDQEKWEELVRVADVVGCAVGALSRAYDFATERQYIVYVSDAINLGINAFDDSKIPYPEFLAKLKGEEKWEPKNGEEVEVNMRGLWMYAEFIAMHKGYYVCNPKYESQYLPFSENQIRPAVETITRHEAESLLNKRIIDPCG